MAIKQCWVDLLSGEPEMSDDARNLILKGYDVPVWSVAACRQKIQVAVTAGVSYEDFWEKALQWWVDIVLNADPPPPIGKRVWATACIDRLKEVWAEMVGPHTAVAEYIFEWEDPLRVNAQDDDSDSLFAAG